jgi:hypothetical protein
LGLEYSVENSYRFGLFKKGVYINHLDDKVNYEYGYSLGYGTYIASGLSVDLYFQHTYFIDEYKTTETNSDGDIVEVHKDEYGSTHFNFGFSFGYELGI